MTNPTYTDEQVLEAASRMEKLADPVRHLGDETGWMTDDVAKMLRQLHAKCRRLQADSITWWNHVAELQEKVKSLQAEVDGLRKDRERYFQLRDNPEDRDVLNTGMPWVVRVERINGVPTMNAIYGPELDYELDAARATPNETKEAKS